MEQGKNHITKLISIKSIQDGMVLGKDLFDFHGRLLLKKGEKLEKQNIRMLKMWSITGVEIVTENLDSLNLEKTKYSKEELEKVKRIAKNKFVNCDLKNEYTQMLFETFTQYLLTKKISYSENKEKQIPPSKILKNSTEAKLHLKHMLQNEINLPSMPEIAVKINEAVNDPHCTAVHIAALLKNDPALSAKLLKIVNSAMYGFPSSIDSLPRAVTIIGPRQVNTLVLGTAVISVFGSISPDLVNMKDYWKQSVACGIVAKLMAGYKKVINTENYFLGGLLHALGRLVLLQIFPEEWKKVYNMHLSTKKPLSILEKEYFGMSQGEIGAFIAIKWKLPSFIKNICEYYTFPEKDNWQTFPLLIHLSVFIVKSLGIGCTGECYAKDVSLGSWEQLGLPVSVLEILIPQAQTQFDEVINNFLGE